MDDPDLRERLTAWWPEIAVGALVVALAIPSLARTAINSISLGDFLVLGLVGASAIAFRRAPGPALGLVWLALLTHLLSIVLFGYGYPQPAEVVVAITAFGTARYGNRSVLILSGLSIPCAVALIFVAAPLFGFGFGFAGGSLDGFPVSTFGWQELLVPIFPVLLLGIPWLLGLVLRSQAAAADSEEAAEVARTGEKRARLERAEAEVERGQAQHIADLRADQSRMAREVHDVVGHSLAVILAQAESAHFLPETDAAEHRRILSDVAGTARQSLQDVRAVLGATRDGELVAVQSTGGMDALVDGVRSAGYEVDSSVVGIPRPLPPERDAVAFRVLQEMLTNAVKHGSRGVPLTVERHWEGELRIDVQNNCEGRRQALSAHGVDGMRRRLESVGGRLDVRRRGAAEGSGGQTFTATAWLPLDS